MQRELYYFILFIWPRLACVDVEIATSPRPAAAAAGCARRRAGLQGGHRRPPLAGASLGAGDVVNALRARSMFPLLLGDTTDA